MATVQVVQQPASPRPTPSVAPRSSAEEAGAPQQPSPETLAMMQRLEARQRAEQERRQMTLGAQSLKTETIKRESDKVGRNDPCPCGSGKKYKKCHGA